MIIKTQTDKQTSWEALKAAAIDGKINTVLRSGDRIPVELKNGEAFELDVAFDANGKVYFVAHDCLHDLHPMNAEASNADGWAGSDMRTYLNDELFEQLPDDVQAVIVPYVSVQTVDGITVESTDNLFCLSATQVFGNGVWTETESNDTQLDIFATDRDRVKNCGSYGAMWWWLRSADENSNFRNVGNSGNANTNHADADAGVVFAFTI